MSRVRRNSICVSRPVGFKCGVPIVHCRHFPSDAWWLTWIIQCLLCVLTLLAPQQGSLRLSPNCEYDMAFPYCYVEIETLFEYSTVQRSLQEVEASCSSSQPARHMTSV